MEKLNFYKKPPPVLVVRVYFAVLLALAASCAYISAAGSAADSHELLADAAVRHAVFAYINDAETEGEKHARAAQVTKVAGAIDLLVVGNPDATAETLLAVINSQIDWAKVDPHDELLIRDVLKQIEHHLNKRHDEGLLSPSVALGLRNILKTVITTAAML